MLDWKSLRDSLYRRFRHTGAATSPGSFHAHCKGLYREEPSAANAAIVPLMAGDSVYRPDLPGRGI